jgi:hypothetical protein
LGLVAFGAGRCGGANLYAYAAHNPTNLIDPSGEILPCLAANYVRCMAACMLMSAAEDYFLECGNVDWGDNAKECAVDCLWSMLPIPNPCGKLGKYFGMGMGIAGAAGMNSFTAETLVQVMPAGASDADASEGKTELKPIGALQVGDKVLALAEWKERGADAKADARLAYERITDIYTSRKEQVLVHLTLASGEQLTATEGHPFKTSEGWRDAVLLKRGGKLLLKGSDGSGSERTADIADVRVERSTVQVFNLEVANAHTFFVGDGGALVHNVHGNSRDSDLEQWVYRIFDKATNATQKYGVANCNSKKSRPEKQLRKGEDYDYTDNIPAGPGARGRAYDRERDRVTDYANQNGGRGPPRNDLPHPW